jgi:hypothetical protein
MRYCSGRAQEILLLRALNRVVICMVIETTVGLGFECCFTDDWMAILKRTCAYARRRPASSNAPLAVFR